MIKTAHSMQDYIINTPYFVNHGTKGLRTLHIFNNPKCPESRKFHDHYEEFMTEEMAMKSDPHPQRCKLCFHKQ